MTEMEPSTVTAADAAFLERCRQDLAACFAPRDAVDAIVRRETADGLVELEAQVLVSGRPASFVARGETVVEAYGRLRSMAPEQRVALAFRVLVDELDAR
jgi:hypothetical protein